MNELPPSIQQRANQLKAARVLAQSIALMRNPELVDLDSFDQVSELYQLCGRWMANRV